MSAAAVNTYKGKIDRGSLTLAQVDQAERGKLVTAAEAVQLRDYWHAVYDVVGLAVAVGADRAQAVTWTKPTAGVGQVVVTRTVDGITSTASASPTTLGVSFPADVGDGEVVVEVSAVVTAVNGYTGPAGTASATVPAVEAPVDPAPVEPAPADASTPEQTPEQIPAADAAAAEPDPAGA